MPMFHFDEKVWGTTENTGAVAAFSRHRKTTTGRQQDEEPTPCPPTLCKTVIGSMEEIETPMQTKPSACSYSRSPDQASAEAHEQARQEDRSGTKHEVLLGAVRRLFRLAEEGVLPQVLSELVQHVVELVHLVVWFGLLAFGFVSSRVQRRTDGDIGWPFLLKRTEFKLFRDRERERAGEGAQAESGKEEPPEGETRGRGRKNHISVLQCAGERQLGGNTWHGTCGARF